MAENPFTVEHQRLLIQTELEKALKPRAHIGSSATKARLMAVVQEATAKMPIRHIEDALYACADWFGERRKRRDASRPSTF